MVVLNIMRKYTCDAFVCSERKMCLDNILWGDEEPCVLT